MTGLCGTCGVPLVAIEAQVDAQTLAHRFVAQCGHQITAEAADAAWRAGMRWTVPVIDGASLGAAERHRQIHEEGYTPEHDADLADDLPWAAWALLDRAVHYRPDDTAVPTAWPWDPDTWKPHEPLRALIIAEALIAAEIDRQLAQRRRGNPT